MKLVLDSLWRALVDCVQWRIVLLTLLPLVLTLLITGLLAWGYWDVASGAMATWLDGSRTMSFLWGWAVPEGSAGFGSYLAPMMLVLLGLPIIILLALLLVSIWVTPAVLKHVVRRRFVSLVPVGQVSWVRPMIWSAAQTALALLVLLLSMPLWLVPPLILVIPPLVWGWLTYRILSHDALQGYASQTERRALVREHRLPLLAMGIASACLGVAPTIVFASAALFVIGFAILIPVGIWIYTLVFTFSALWFTHYCLSALACRRTARAAEALPGEA